MGSTLNYSDATSFAARSANEQSKHTGMLNKPFATRKQAGCNFGFSDVIDQEPVQGRWESNTAYAKRLTKWRARNK